MPNADIRANQFTDKDTGQVVRFKDIVATFGSVNDMQVFPGLRIGQKVRTLGYYAPGDGGGCDYEIVAEGTGSSFGFLFEQLASSGLEAKLLGGGIIENKVVGVPTDFDDLQEAFDFVSTIFANKDSRIDINIEAGASIRSGVYAENGNFSHIHITSDDSEVLLDSDFTGDFINAANCYAPTLSCLINGNESCDNGYYLTRNSTGQVDSGCGVTNSGGNGLHLRASRFYGQGSIWDGSRSVGARIQQTSTATLQSSSINNCAKDSFASRTSVYVSRASVVNMDGSSIRDGGGIGVLVRRSWVNLLGSKVERNAESGVRASQGAFVIINNEGYSVNNQGFDVQVDQGSFVTYNGFSSFGSDSNIRANSLTPQGFLLDESSENRSLSLIASGGSMSSVGDEGYWVRSDGWGKCWKILELDLSEGGNVNFDTPIIFSGPFLQRSITASYSPNYVQSEALTSTVVSGTNSAWAVRVIKTRDEVREVTLTAEGYVDLSSLP